MARNIEIKARIADLAAARTIVLALGARPVHVEEQIDRYYRLETDDRLKLRTFGNGRAELIRYQRAETAGVRTSDYEVTPVRDRETHTCLVPKTDPLVIVRKRRELLLIDNVRVHLDTVERLGTFLELEAVVDGDHDDRTCRGQVDRIVAALQLRDQDLLRASYADLLRAE